MIHYKSNEEIEKLKQSCKIVNDSIAHAASFLKPGISTLELNDIAEEFILAQGAVPNFKNYHVLLHNRVVSLYILVSLLKYRRFGSPPPLSQCQDKVPP